jgi:hypothetical protein
VVPAEVFLDEFVSDRSHMLLSTPGLDAATTAILNHSDAPDGSGTGTVSSSTGSGNNIEIYSAPPPYWPAIRGRAVPASTRTNLMDAFVAMSPEVGRPATGFGTILDRRGFTAWCDEGEA